MPDIIKISDLYKPLEFVATIIKDGHIVATEILCGDKVCGGRAHDMFYAYNIYRRINDQHCQFIIDNLNLYCQLWTKEDCIVELCVNLNGSLKKIRQLNNDAAIA